MTESPQIIKNVTVLGTGVLGSQIIYQTAYSGFAVTAYDINDEALAAAKERLIGYSTIYPTEVAGADADKAAAVPGDVIYTADLASAVADADLVIEAIPEVLELKRSTYEELARLAPAKTIFASNSSTLLPSAIKDFTGRPDRFLHLHFANHIWVLNIAEVMGSADTDPEVYKRTVEFAEQIGMVPIQLHKEQPGYVLNSLLVPLLNAASKLLINEVADPETIDKTWRLGTGAPFGPFQIFDVVGLNTAYAISSASDDADQRKFAAYIKDKYIDQGKLGTATGEGFYTY